MTGLIDFEAAYIGDPIAEFAAMRSRDCEEPLGDIGRIARKYEAVTGERIDKNAVEFHTAGWSLMTPFQWEDSVRNPAPGTAGWSTSRGSSAAGGERSRPSRRSSAHRLATVEPPAERPSSYWGAAYTNLMALLDEWPTSSSYESFRADSARAVTRFAEHVHAYGAALEASPISRRPRRAWRSSCSAPPRTSTWLWCSTSTGGPSASSSSSRAPVPGTRSSSTSACSPW
jgi:hypothetical protein